MGSTVAVGSLEITSNTESADAMSKALAPVKEHGKEPRVLVDGGKDVEPKGPLSEAASELGKAGGKAAAEARKAVDENERRAERQMAKDSGVEGEAKPEEGKPEAAEEKPGHRREDARTRIQQLVQEREEARRQAAEYQARLEALEAGRKAPGGTEPPVAPVEDDFPDFTDVDSHETYEAAVKSYVKRAIAYAKQEMVREAQQEQQKTALVQEVERTKTEFQEKMGKELAEAPDLSERIDPELTSLLETYTPGKPLTARVVIGTEVAKSATPLRLLAYFSEHPEEVRKLAAMSTPREIVLGVARLEAKLESAPPTIKARPSNAPEPFKPLQPSSVPGDPDVMGDIDFDTFASRMKAKRR